MNRCHPEQTPARERVRVRLGLVALSRISFRETDVKMMIRELPAGPVQAHNRDATRRRRARAVAGTVDRAGTPGKNISPAMEAARVKNRRTPEAAETGASETGRANHAVKVSDAIANARASAATANAAAGNAAAARSWRVTGVE